MRFYLFQADLNPDDKAIATEIALAIQEQGQVPITIQDHNIYVELPIWENYPNEIEDMPFWFGTRFVDSIISLNQRTGGDFYEGRDNPSVRVLQFGDNTYNENQELTGISIAITGTEWRNVPETYTLIPPIPSLNSFPEYWSEDTKERIRHFHQKIKMRYEQYQQAYRQHSHHQALRHSIADARMSIAMINELIEQEVSGSTGHYYRTPHLTDIARNPLNYSLIWNKVAALYLISKKSLPGSISMRGSQWLTYAVLAITLSLLSFFVLSATHFLLCVMIVNGCMAAIISLDIRIQDSRALFYVTRAIEQESQLKDKIVQLQTTYSNHEGIQCLIQTVKGSPHLSLYEKELWLDRAVNKLELRSNYFNLVKTLFNPGRLCENRASTHQRQALNTELQQLTSMRIG